MVGCDRARPSLRHDAFYPAENAAIGAFETPGTDASRTRRTHRRTDTATTRRLVSVTGPDAAPVRQMWSPVRWRVDSPHPKSLSIALRVLSTSAGAQSLSMMLAPAVNARAHPRPIPSNRSQRRLALHTHFILLVVVCLILSRSDHLVGRQETARQSCTTLPSPSVRSASVSHTTSRTGRSATGASA